MIRVAFIGGIGIILLVALVFLSPLMAPSLSLNSPSGRYYVKGLPFKGSSPTDLDGTLRIYIRKNGAHLPEKKIQTDIPYSRDLKFTWIDHTFSIVNRGSVLATCEVEDDSVRWTIGSEHLVNNPYSASADSPPN